MKYWFVSYSFIADNGFGFGNCFVSGNDFLLVDRVQKWAKEREGFKSVRVLFWKEISEAEYVHGIETLEKPRPTDGQGKGEQ